MQRMIIGIQKMAQKPSDYFQYSMLTPDMRRWGVGVTGAGLATVPAGAAYPPPRHPADHDFAWAHGRVLDRLQIVLILDGAGWLETRATRRRRIGSGMAFLLLPKVWHRYRPDPKTGWRESWIELDGPVLDELLLAETFPPAAILRDGAVDAGLDELFARVHQRVRQGVAGHAPELAATVLQILAVLTRLGGTRQPVSGLQRAVRSAQHYLAAHHAEPLNMQAVAERFGVAYSHFRRAFRAQTGIAPWQYVVQLRLTRARRLLAASDAKLDDIAERVGFCSGFHLSLSFKQAYGIPPSEWRKSLAQSR